MIKSFQHKGLRLLFEDDDRRKLNAEYVDRLRLILSSLDIAETIEDMNQLTFRLHPLTAVRKKIDPLSLKSF
jgi:proteic killer suppression protein